MIDQLFKNIFELFWSFPSIVVSGISYMLCIVAIYICRRFFGYAGLYCYMIVANILANIQVLYATHYEILNSNVLLGTIVFCSSFLACDIINKEHGKNIAKRIVYLTFVLEIFFLLSVILTLGHKPIAIDGCKNFGISFETLAKNAAAMEQIFLPIPRLLIASYAAYFASQMTEIWAFHAIKDIKTIKSDYIKHNISLFISTILVDTIVFTFLSMVLFAPEPLSINGLASVCFSTTVVRFCCNIGNSVFMKKMYRIL